ncbi:MULTISPECIES: DUF6636 domain-containing protein [unclassified Rhodococcus (in: high G+C Gram-positive bacteria)]|uniref:DUF6636 domain-containing protein n=1 Tax=unclassified Rhodococcus (in: high G+C Gram-positive bacteria) TaxID=192944 RepID=UPI0007BC1D56|nr:MULTISPECIES: DUF6636 domain-containing protein [unclassified Rhodococcus (in: high G+C Gram-positive bacteria)]KZE99581.1 hypothetical protein A2J02_10945 [Rhodococcus sp. EPR-147]KZF00101.1 hypothetical protein A2J04_12385 [Rhodococcus sp. EPR-279]
MGRLRAWSVGIGAAALVLAGCSSESAAQPPPQPSTTTLAPTTTTATTTPAPVTTTEEALPPPPPPVEPPPTAEPQTTYAAIGGAFYFSSPDGLFQCGIVPLSNRTEAGCQGTTTPVPPRPEDCMINWGNGIRVTNQGPAAFMCSGGVVYTSGGETIDPPLAVGATIAENGFTCTSAENGISCVDDATGHGFRIAPDSNEIY